MNLFINNTSGIPLYEQLSAQIKDHIIAGRLKKDDPLPSMRALASDLHISVITTKRTYEELAREGFLYSVPAKGYFVAEVSRADLTDGITARITAHLTAACTEAGKIGMAAAELHRLLDTVIAKSDQEVSQS